MRITDVRVHLVEAAIPMEHRVESGAGQKRSRQAAIVEVETDIGLSGVGSCSFGSVSFELGVVRELVAGAFKPLLLGRDPRQIQRIWDDLYYGLILRSLGHRGVAIAVLSGIDVALWDLKGRVLGVPVYDLLGGPVRDQMPAYASSVYWASPEECADAATVFVQRGYTAVKLKIGREPTTDIACVRAVRQALPAHVELMVDANMGYTRGQALLVGRCLDELGISFFEEPLSVDDVSGYARLAAALDTRLAIGENLYTRWGFQPFIDTGVAVAQPDCSRCGGISEARRVIDLASVQHVGIAPHTFSDALTLVANLHVALSDPAAFTLEVDETYNPLMIDLVQHQVEITGGRVRPPTGPGLGVDLNWEWIDAHPYHGSAGIGTGIRPGG